MTQLRQRRLALALLVTLAACAEDSFSRRQAQLVVTVVTEGQVYQSYDNDSRTVDLGEVPVHASKVAIFKLENPTGFTLIIDQPKSVDQAGERWLIDEIDAPSTSASSHWPKRLDALQSTLLRVVYAPTAIGNDDSIKVNIPCNASNAVNGAIDVTVLGKGGEPIGAPDISVAYGSYEGPDPQLDCATRFDGDTPVVETDAGGNPIINVCRAQVADLGNIGLGAQGRLRLRLRNSAECLDYPGIDACESCAVIVDKDPTRQNIGFGFKADTNIDNLFEFEGRTATPFEIRQRRPECGATGEVALSMVFNAPDVEGPHSAVVVVESNDPDEPLIEVPVRAYARNAPVAIANFRQADATNPSAPYTNPDDIEPLDRVYFDGRKSYDPRDPADPSLIAQYRWEVLEYPSGSNPNDFAMQGENSSLFSFWLPLAGHYEIKLTVVNTDGIESGDTPESHVSFDAVPSDRMHIQLVWDDSVNDQDLHLTFASVKDVVCDDLYDCHWRNCEPDDGSDRPIWFNTDPAGVGPNPSLDIDDTNGLGPENINIDEPEPGTYRIYVHYYPSWESNPTRETVRIFLNGIQRAEYRRTLTETTQIWAVADIVWMPDGTAYVTPYPSDVAGQIGAVSKMPDCSSSGWVFP